MGGQCSQFSPSGNGANGRKHLRLLPDSCKTAYGAGTWLSLLRPGCFYSFYRGAPENAVSQSREKPNHRCPLCTGRAVHWTPPGKYRWTDRGYGWSDRWRKFRYFSRPWHTDLIPCRLAHWNGAGSRRKRGTGDRRRDYFWYCGK